MTDFYQDLRKLTFEFGYESGADLLGWLRSQLEIARGYDARVTELLHSNTKYLEERRAAQAEAVKLRHDLEMTESAWLRSLDGKVFRKAHFIDALVKTTEHVVARARHADHLDAIAAGRRRGIYVASKLAHTEMWRMMRAAGLPIISTWIDVDQATANLGDLWRRCIVESSTAEVLIVYREPDEQLKGGWIEMGSALSSGVPVFAVGIREFTVAHYIGVTHFDDLTSAVAAAREFVAKAA